MHLMTQLEYSPRRPSANPVFMRKRPVKVFPSQASGLIDAAHHIMVLLEIGIDRHLEIATPERNILQKKHTFA